MITDARRSEFLDVAARSELPFTPQEADLIEGLGQATEFTETERRVIDSMIRKYAVKIHWRP
jgi:hypothetical protein